MKAYLTAFILLAAVVSAEHPSNGQIKRSIQDFDFIMDSNPWLTSSNAAGLHTLQTDRTSVVNVLFNKENGGFMGTDESADMFNAGVSTESFVRISPKISFSGKMSYSYNYGKDMGGNILMFPSYNPLNFVENTDTTQGVKIRELYQIAGGISYKFNEKWAIGANVDYISGNQAKRKDPRYQSMWMDIDLSAGARFAPGKNFALGLNGIYRKTLEYLKGGIYGTTDKQYFTFVDYGSFYGKREFLESNNGYILKSEQRPIFNNFYGGSVQIETGDRIKLVNELTFLIRDGYFGRKASSFVTYFENSGYVASYEGNLLIRKGNNLHKVYLEGSYEKMSNFENSYRYLNNPGEATVVEYYAQKQVLDKNIVNGNIGYRGYLGIDNLRPSWEYGIDATGSYTGSETTIYPYYRLQTIATVSVDISGLKNIISGKNIYTIGLNAIYGMGFGTKNEDGSYASTSSDAPRSSDTNLNWDFEYKTAGRVTGQICFRYTRLFSDKFSGFINIADSYTQALQKPEFMPESYRNIFTLTLGCSF